MLCFRAKMDLADLLVASKSQFKSIFVFNYIIIHLPLYTTDQPEFDPVDSPYGPSASKLAPLPSDSLYNNHNYLQECFRRQRQRQIPLRNVHSQQKRWCRGSSREWMTNPSTTRNSRRWHLRTLSSGSNKTWKYSRKLRAAGWSL